MFAIWVINIGLLLALSRVVRKAEQRFENVSQKNRIATMPFLVAFSPTLFLIGGIINVALASAMYRSDISVFDSPHAMFATCSFLWFVFSFASNVKLKRLRIEY